jgi:predicted RNA-binding protein with PUA-like domain
MRYWIFKSDPDVFAFEDLLASPGQATGWDGVRNYQARNYLRDEVQRGDRVLFHHSQADPPALVGIAEVIEEAHPDPTAFDPASPHHDPRSRPEAPTWFQVTIRALRRIDPPLTLSRLKSEPRLEGLELLRKGSRLSVQPVSPQHWAVLLEMADAPRT